MAFFSFKCVCTEKASCWWVVKRIINYLYFINFLWHKKTPTFFPEKTWKPHIFNLTKRRSFVKKDGKPRTWLQEMWLFSFKSVRTEKASSWWVVKRIINYSYFINFLWHKRCSNFFTEKTWKSHIFNLTKRRSFVKKDGKPRTWLQEMWLFHSSEYV